MTTETERRQRILDAAEGLAARGPRHGITLESIAREARLELDDVTALFPSDSEVMFALGIAGLEGVADAVTEELRQARSGADAMTRFVRRYMQYYEEHRGAFRAFFLMTQSEGRESAGLDDQRLRERGFPAGNRKLDALEAWLARDRGPSDLAGGINPRRLAFVAEIAGVGLMMVRGVNRAIGFASKHSDDDTVREFTHALGAATATVRQLSALNDVATRLATLRRESELCELVPQLLASALDCSDATMQTPPLAAELPACAHEALLGDKTAWLDTEPEGEHGYALWIATPVRSEGRIESIVLARPAMSARARARAGRRRSPMSRRSTP